MQHPLSQISIAEAAQYASQYYGFSGTLRKLPGEVDFNFHLESKDGQEYTLKISRPETPIAEIDFQLNILEHLSKTAIPLEIPQTIPTLTGENYVQLDQQQFIRLQKWVPGRMLSEVNPRSPQVLDNWGKTAALFSKHLADFDHPTAHRFYKWNPSEVGASKKYRSYIQDPKEQNIADYFWNLFDEKALPHLPSLRKSVNYNDAHEHNLLCNQDPLDPQITGVIDFGDALYTETINELAIACAYAGMFLPDPLLGFAQVLKAYHSIFPVEEKELAVLFPLIAARLLLSVSNAALKKHEEPNNSYLLISEKPAWDLLKKMHQISPAFAHYTFRQSCGLVPCPIQTNFQHWVKQNQKTFTALLDFNQKEIGSIDLSVGSPDLGNNANFNTIKNFQKTVTRFLEDQQIDIALGGYLEHRPIYTTDAYLVEGNSGAQWRTLHLGLDAWAPAGTAIFAPLDAKVHSFQNNDVDGDYGPTIILEHRVTEGLTFFTLYGHLSLDSLTGLQEGMSIRKGQKIAEIGPAPINGNWPPHLHFQILLDPLDKRGDFPGVAFPEETEVWKSICPDPSPFFPSFSKNKKSKSAQDILQSRKNHLGKSLSISYQKPLHIVRAFQQYLYDQTGRRFLDTANNVPHVGHQHPRVVQAAQQQIGLLNTNTRYLHENIIQFAESLVATFPPELSVVHFVNSGSEANELAMRMATATTGQKDMVAIEVGYHGNTAACIDVSSYKFDGKGGAGAPPHTHIVPLPDVYRGRYRDPKTAGKKYAATIETAIKKIQSTGRNISGFLCESIISCGGQIVLPKGFLKEAYRHVRAAGGVCIADEVQVGFGRVGEKFWAFELQEVVPDIVTLGKPIGNGHPLAAVVTTQKIAQDFANGMEYFNTFGGNPVSCAIGQRVLEIVQEEGLQTHALVIEELLKEGLYQLQKRFPIIGDIRGHGLFLGIELVKNLETLEPAAAATSYLANRMRERGILMGTDGPFHNVLKIKPPMCFDASNVDFLLENLELVLQEDFMRQEAPVLKEKNIG